MRNYAILMAIFGVLIILMGLYIYTGHDDLIPRYHAKEKDLEYLRYLGKIVIAVGLAPLGSAITAFFSKNDRFYPFVVLLVLSVAALWIGAREYKK